MKEGGEHTAHRVRIACTKLDRLASSTRAPWYPFSFNIARFEENARLVDLIRVVADVLLGGKERNWIQISDACSLIILAFKGIASTHSIVIKSVFQEQV